MSWTIVAAVKVKFSLAEDDRPVLASELPLRSASRDELGLAIARSLLIADQLLEESASWLWIGGRIPDQSGRVSRGAGLIARYADRLGELIGEPADAPATAADAPASPDAADAEPDAADAEPAADPEPAAPLIIS